MLLEASSSGCYHIPSCLPQISCAHSLGGSSTQAKPQHQAPHSSDPASTQLGKCCIHPRWLQRAMEQPPRSGSAPVAD